MRASILLVFCWLSGVFVTAAFISAQRDVFVPMAVTYPSALAADRERADADFEAIQTLGFNTVRVTIDWASVERSRGAYDLDALERSLGLAAKWKLGAVLRIDTGEVPAWVANRYSDARFVPETPGQLALKPRLCLDHPGVRADTSAFIAAASARASRSGAWQAIEFEDVTEGFCLCRYTQELYRNWLTETYGREARPTAAAAADRAAFVAFQNREHLDFLVRAASERRGRLAIGSVRQPSILRLLANEPPGQDDWSLAPAVDLYGVAVPPDAGRVAGLGPPQLEFALDGVRSAAGEKGWLMIDRTVARAAEPAAGVELRSWTWAALSRGARGVFFGDWRSRAQGEGSALVEADGTITPRGRAAGTAARIVGRNAALFAALRPRHGSVAIVYDPRPGATGEVARPTELSNVYTTLFRRNIAVDLLHLDTISPDAVNRYKAIFVGPMSTLPAPVALTLKRFAEAGGVLVSDAGTLLRRAVDRRHCEGQDRAGSADRGRHGKCRDAIPGIVRSRDDCRHQPRRYAAACDDDVRARRPGSDLAEHGNWRRRELRRRARRSALHLQLRSARCVCPDDSQDDPLNDLRRADGQAIAKLAKPRRSRRSESCTCWRSSRSSRLRGLGKAIRGPVTAGRPYRSARL